MTISELFGTLQQSVTAQWRKHLQTDRYSTHMALDEFYKEMPEKVDALIEAYQADNDIVKDYKNILDEGLDAIEYLNQLKEIVREGRELLGSTELESLCDDILSQIDSTLYKLKHLRESMSLGESISMSLPDLCETVLDKNLDVDAPVKFKELEKLVIDTLTKKGKYPIFASNDYTNDRPEIYVTKHHGDNPYGALGNWNGPYDSYRVYFVCRESEFSRPEYVLGINIWDDTDAGRPRYSFEQFEFLKPGGGARDLRRFPYWPVAFCGPKKCTAQWFSAVKDNIQGIFGAFFDNTDLMKQVYDKKAPAAPPKAQWDALCKKVFGKYLK